MAVSTPPQPAKPYKATSPETLAEPSEPGGGNESGKWMALAAALLGWLFDGAEMGIFPMVARPAIKDLLHTTDDTVVGLWFGIITAGFLVGAATGGVLFGWLGDRIGRVRAMTLSVLTYAIFTGLCGLSTNIHLGSLVIPATLQLGLLRFIASLGMGGEWSLGVALVMEVWPNRSRAFMAGLIGAAANVGYLLVGFTGLALAKLMTPAALEGWGWRMMMILGTLPALLTFFIRIFVPESKKWEQERERGSTGHWATRDLLGVLIGLAGPALIIFLCAYKDGARWIPLWPFWQVAGTILGLLIAVAGYTYPVIRFFQRLGHSSVGGGENWRPTLLRMMLGACLSGVALLGTWGSTQWAPTWADTLAEKQLKADQQALIANGKPEEAAQLVKPRAKEFTQIWLAVGAIIGTILAALMGDWMGRRGAYCLLCGLSLISVYALFLGNTSYGPVMLFWTFLAGTLTASFYGWLPLYLPELFRTNVRATGQGFGFNFGRILAAIGVLQTGNLMGLFKEGLKIGSLDIAGGYPLACSSMSLVYLVGMAIIWLAPETHGKPLPE